MKIAAYIRNQFESDIQSIAQNIAEDGMKALKGLKGAEAYRAWVEFRRNYYGEADFNVFDNRNFSIKMVNAAREAGFIAHLDGCEPGTFAITAKGHNAIYKAYKSWAI